MAKANELKQFTKDEIIEALSKKYDWLENNHTISSLISEIKQGQLIKNQKECDIAYEKLKEASEVYLNYLKELQSKYGEKFPITVLSPEEFDAWAKLDDIRIRADKRWMKLIKQKI